MTQHHAFELELTKLNKKLLLMTSMVEDRVRRATHAINTKDRDILKSLMMSDYEIDDMEIDIEEDCLKILALHHPVARDLRLIVAIIKINNEMERIGDIAVNIAKRVDLISKFHHPEAITYDFTDMSEKAIMMLKKAIDAMVQRNAKLAKTIFLDDDAVDALRNKCYDDIKIRIKNDPDHPGYHINTYLLARHLERIADRALNIAEEVIYLVEGTITRFH